MPFLHNHTLWCKEKEGAIFAVSHSDKTKNFTEEKIAEETQEQEKELMEKELE